MTWYPGVEPRFPRKRSRNSFSFVRVQVVLCEHDKNINLWKGSIDFLISSWHEKATEALYIGRIQTRLGVVFASEFSGLSFASDFFNLLLVRFHQAEIIIMKHLIRGRNNEAWIGVEPSTLRLWSYKRRSQPLHLTLLSAAWIHWWCHRSKTLEPIINRKSKNGRQKWGVRWGKWGIASNESHIRLYRQMTLYSRAVKHIDIGNWSGCPHQKWPVTQDNHQKRNTSHQWWCNAASRHNNYYLSLYVAPPGDVREKCLKLCLFTKHYCLVNKSQQKQTWSTQGGQHF